MTATLAPLSALAELIERTCVACVCVQEIRGTGSCSTRRTFEAALLEQLDPAALTTLAIVAIGVIGLAAGTLLAVGRPGPGPGVARDVPVDRPEL